MDLLEVWKHKNSVVHSGGRGDSNENKKWMAPEADQLKLDVDASMVEGADSFSIGMVLRDQNSTFLGGKTQ